MKKTLILAAAALVAGSALAAEVLSVNAVGFIQTTCPAGQYTALSCPFYGNDSDTGGTAWTNTPIAKSATGGEKVYFWNGTMWSVGEYVKGRTGVYAWDAVAAAKVLEPGECFLYKPVAEQDAIVSGEVPDDASIELAIAGGGAYTALGLPYPVETAWTNTALALGATGGEKAYFWNGSMWSVGEYVKGRTGVYAWDAVAAGKTLAPGEGFLYKLPANAAATTVETTRPYDWPAEPVAIVNP